MTIFFRLNTLKLYYDKSNRVILDFNTLSDKNLQMVTLTRNHPTRAPPPFLFHGLRILDGAESFFVFFSRKMAKCRFWLTFVPRSIQHKSQQISTFSNQLRITTTHLRPPRHNPHFSTSQIFFLLKPTEKTVIFFYKFFLFTAFHSPLYTCLQKIVTFLYLFPTLTTF